MEKDHHKSIEQIQKKAERLMKFSDKLLEQNKNLLKEREGLTKLIDNQNVELKRLEEKNKVIKIAGYITEHNENKTEIKQKINELLREIDKCIAALSR